MKKAEQHFTAEELASVDTMEDRMLMLKHIASCPLCSERLSETFPAQKQIRAPHYLKRSILAKARRMEQKKREFHAYCMKIGLAVAASLAVVLLSGATESFVPPKHLQKIDAQSEIPREKPDISIKIYRGTDKINQKIIDFTDSLFGIK